MERGSGPRRDGPGARRFNGYDWSPPAPTPPQKPIVRAKPRTQNREPRNKVPGGDVTPITKGVPDGWPASSDVPWVVKAVARRSGGRCEARLKGCQREAHHRHHRKRRRFGDHRPVNLAHLCHACHSFIHNNVDWALMWGWLLRGDDDPEVLGQGDRRPD